MVTSPRVSTPPSTTGVSDSSATYTATLEKMEKEALADLEKAFADIAVKAKEESDTIWGDLKKDFEEIDKEDE